MSEWRMRTSAPSATNKYFIKTTYGGLNYCMLRDSATGSVLPNCTGFAWGRFIEGVGETFSNLSRGDASSWYGNTADGYQRGQSPKVGAVMCWGGGYYSGAGHVCIVEKVIDDNTVITGESDYSGARWYSKTRHRGADGRWGMNDLFSFQGFIYNPWVDGESSPSEDASIWSIITMAQGKRKKVRIK